MYGAVALHGRGQYRQLQRVEGGAGVAVGHAGDVFKGVLVDAHVLLAIAALPVGDGAPQSAFDALAREPLEAEQAAAADDGRGHGDHRVLRGGADEADDAALDGGQNGVRLRLGPAVALVQKQVGRLAVDAQALFGHLEYVAHVGHAAGDGVELHEGGARGLRDDGCQRGLARARRAPEDGAGQAVGLDGAAQELALAHDLLLPDEL